MPCCPLTYGRLLLDIKRMWAEENERWNLLFWISIPSHTCNMLCWPLLSLPLVPKLSLNKGSFTVFLFSAILRTCITFPGFFENYWTRNWIFLIFWKTFFLLLLLRTVLFDCSCFFFLCQSAPLARINSLVYTTCFADASR